MIFEPVQLEPLRQAGIDGHAAPVVGALPAPLVFNERATAILRAFLDARGLGEYQIFYSGDLSLDDIDEHKQALDPDCDWEPLTPMVSGGDASLTMLGEGLARSYKTGALVLERHRIVVARWYWVDVGNYSMIRDLTLCAAPTSQQCTHLRGELTRLRGASRRSYWQVVHGEAHADGARIPREVAAIDDMILAPALRQRVDSDIIPFFSEPVAKLYRALGVPQRRGVLLHGPPGNGKTSLIRLIGARLPDVGAMLLRPCAGFDSDDLQRVIERWKQNAPAILVIEDLNWLLKQVNVSTFLNLLDGLDNDAAGGLLLIATTNYPDDLDGAINNRPGRFDVVIEMPSPDAALRKQFLSRKLTELSEPAIDRAVSRTEGLSFSHLQEILRVSGFRAIAAGRSARTDADLADAVELVSQTNAQANKGFPGEVRPFGFVPPAQKS